MTLRKSHRASLAINRMTCLYFTGKRLWHLLANARGLGPYLNLPSDWTLDERSQSPKKLHCYTVHLEQHQVVYSLDNAFTKIFHISNILIFPQEVWIFCVYIDLFVFPFMARLQQTIFQGNAGVFDNNTL